MSSMELPSTQRQWQQVGRGLPKDVLQLVPNAPMPKLRKGEVLVKISHAAMTPGSWKIMGSPLSYFRHGAVPELEAAGWVADPNGSVFQKGDEVVGALEQNTHIFGGIGTLSEYAVFPSEYIFPKPSSMSMEEAAGLLSSGMTAYKALVEEGHFKTGWRLFINGGTTASGIAAIQIAKALGAAYIAVSCSSGSFELVKGLGADEAIDYKSSPLNNQLSSRFSNQPFDIILDCVGHHSLFVACPAFLKSEGVFVSIAVDTPEMPSPLEVLRIAANTLVDVFLPTWLGGTPRRFVFSRTPPARHRLLDSLRWAEEGKLKILVDSTHSSSKDGVMAAYSRVMSGRAKGKVVINMQDS
ncbi:hypothetical protein BOTBODRAFT_33668 [Botryobasidium botryosum FD-172 SS1]|uniref:Enoyl reductase (ER) domain-containing protein n=1 Tax=Botryobasidium botryosum (strain FD-172 SS1) TaxID=930990 RepID=A0A067MNC6_BOTB1|nr:hypothetical protein BOTBODRAFT_33668 [Botryobasidium botryosum FD-172 SS1]